MFYCELRTTKWQKIDQLAEVNEMGVACTSHRVQVPHHQNITDGKMTDKRKEKQVTGFKNDKFAAIFLFVLLVNLL